MGQCINIHLSVCLEKVDTDQLPEALSGEQGWDHPNDIHQWQKQKVFQLYLSLHPEDHIKRRQKQRLQLKCKSDPIKCHRPGRLVLQHKIQRPQNKACKNNIALCPHRSVCQNGRYHQKRSIA